MEEIMKWLSTNKEWFFSGIGVLLFSFIIKIFCNFFNRKKEKTINQVQKSGNKSINVQSARDININSRDKEK